MGTFFPSFILSKYWRKVAFLVKISMIQPEIICLDSELKMPLMSLPIRSVIVKTKQNTVLISPSPHLQLKDIPSDIKVTDVVAPSLLHHLGLENARALFPEAHFWGAPGLQEKRKNFSFHSILINKSCPFEKEFMPILIEGMPHINEVVFYHVKSKTLICTDLCFHLIHARGIGAWIILNIFGTYRRFAISKLYLRYVKDHNLFQKSMKRLLTLEIERIIMGHGDVIEKNGNEILTKAFQERFPLETI